MSRGPGISGSEIFVAYDCCLRFSQLIFGTKFVPLFLLLTIVAYVLVNFFLAEYTSSAKQCASAALPLCNE